MKQVLALVLLGTSCALVPSHERSNAREREKVEVSVEPEEDRAGPEAFVGAAILAPLVVDLAVQGFRSQVKKEAELFQGTYSGSVQGERFYEKVLEGELPGSSGVVIKELRIERRAAPEGKEAPEEALELVLRLEGVSDEAGGVALCWRPEELWLKFAKAKTHGGSSWWRPWTWFSKADDDVDIDIKITTDAVWRDKKGDINSKTIGISELSLRGVPMNQKLDEKDLRAKATPETSSWFPAVPRSYLGDNKWGRGIYRFTVQVREFDDYGKRVADFAQYVESNREGLTKALGKLLEGD